MEPVMSASQVNDVLGSLGGATSGLLACVAAAVGVLGLVRAVLSVRSTKSELQELDARLRQVRNSETIAMTKRRAIEIPDLLERPEGEPGGSVPQSSSKLESVGPEPTDLSLAALWPVTQERIDTYHSIVTKQARRSFVSTQVTAGAGFAIVLGLGVLAATAPSFAASVTTASVGVIGGALSTYLGATFMKASAQANAQLRRFFAQPMENTRLLGIERLIETLPPAERSKAILKVIDKMNFTIDEQTSAQADR
ncbi:hypothetical protein [Curtobacterium sp. MCPF17_021]|uniref:TRADD-N-associated membrane domain-containing protein n=1 Tax=Curtobacterium sp. MCPF17_021 TaxID=2175639 RepID=UPI000DA739BC|nr:hypothetical protein [Curtobacterium sp. MCPF17_021]WIE83356.1 hypothetical protein DEJ29_000545 [Curtobacterium sp. MCPF17_021]